MTMLGGVMGLLLAPVLVIVKYLTGWAVVPEPPWVGPARDLLGGLLLFASPPGLWMAYGSLYTIALCLMLVGLIAVRRRVRQAGGRPLGWGYGLLLAGLCLVIPGDAVHTWTWHQHGLTTPTPGTHPLANTAYAAHMMGMNLIMVGALAVGVSALRRGALAPWLAWAFLLVFPSAVLASITVLPTTPSGALWGLSGLMTVCGFLLATGRARRLRPG